MAPASIFGPSALEAIGMAENDPPKHIQATHDVSAFQGCSSNAGPGCSGTTIQANPGAMLPFTSGLMSPTYRGGLSDKCLNDWNSPEIEVCHADGFIATTWNMLANDGIQVPTVEYDMMSLQDAMDFGSDVLGSPPERLTEIRDQGLYDQDTIPWIPNAVGGPVGPLDDLDLGTPDQNKVDDQVAAFDNTHRLQEDVEHHIDIQLQTEVDQEKLHNSEAIEGQVKDVCFRLSVEPNRDAESKNENIQSQGQSSGLDDADFTSRELRPQSRANQYVTWVDQDTSGDFDPEEEARKERAQRNKTRMRVRRQSHARKKKETAESISIDVVDVEHDTCIAGGSAQTDITHQVSDVHTEEVEPLSQQIPVTREGAANPNLQHDARNPQSGHCKRIKTNFTHPILFNCDAFGCPCSFCTEPLTQLSGFPETEVEVFDWNDFRPFEETKARDGTWQPTYLCSKCTWDRMKIVNCQDHVLQAIMGVDPKQEDHERAVTAFLDESVRDVGMFCTLCFNVASRQCRQHLDLDGEDKNGADDSEICGLRLCDACDLRLQSIHDRDFDRLLESLSSSKPQGLLPMWRADTEFLRNGLIERHCRWASWAMQDSQG